MQLIIPLPSLPPIGLVETISTLMPYLVLTFNLSSSCTKCGTVGNRNPTITADPASCNLTDKCHLYLANGLAPSTRQVYGLAQCQFLEFCSQDSPSNWNQPLLPTNEQPLRFCAHLADQLHHTLIKVYLSAVQSLHICFSVSRRGSNSTRF